ncbi:Alpha/Beta hydrolase protein [Aspergillus bertholletiae]|uniref:Alpha/Beta hydrolase protein n=1 Tax=Aspergillus bertholletiae TaxID=1226010 RepID=A0A5N7BKZ6_9EURO|nr:Alpha/Beta hydrolase protein [Aspergillus bertholletiae]
MPLRYDPEFAQAAGPRLEQYAAKPKAAVHDVESRRALFTKTLSKDANYPIPEGLQRLVHYASTTDGHKVAIYHFRDRKHISGLNPAVLHIHGGGYFSFSALHSTEALVDYVSKSGVQMLSVEYRLSPEHRFPIPLEDCWAALTWVHSQAESLHIDPRRIGVMGESAGGGLAANLAMLARDRNLSPPLAKQLLIYPMLDDRTSTDATEGHAFWTPEDNMTGWGAYLGEDIVGTDAVPHYAVAARNTNADGLPELYIDCGQLDILLPETLKYVGTFLDAGIPTELHIYDGLPHGFTSLAPFASCSRRAIAYRAHAMTTL